ncbi:hypothetical protein FQA39_LY18668 [Lamprigera yunnana]|nr:hypothetical protein FQA39_LY18668 [Lamprigera yunnana]
MAGRGAGAPWLWRLCAAGADLKARGAEVAEVGIAALMARTFERSMALAKVPPHEEQTPLFFQPHCDCDRQLFCHCGRWPPCRRCAPRARGEPFAGRRACGKKWRVEVPVEKIVEVRVEVPVEVPVERIVEKPIATPGDNTAALQLLGPECSGEARFVDFIQEDVAPYTDAEIGAAARVVHEGCRKVLREHITIAPVRSEAEGSRVTLPAGFDAAAVRLSGNVQGQPPFTGTLGHRGWQANADHAAPVDRPASGQNHRPGRGGAVSMGDSNTPNSIAAGAIPASATGQKDSKFSIGMTWWHHALRAVVHRQASQRRRAGGLQAVLGVPQLTGPASVESKSLLPSFLYLPHDSELSAADMALPGGAAQDCIVGELARTRGAATPIRLVSSAKSWLCHPGVDRRSPLLPADAPAEVQRISPLAASIRYLSHLRWAWEQAHPDAPFDAQDITVTIPASFDPAAPS